MTDSDLFPTNATPEQCPAPERPCQYERERHDLHRELRELRKLILAQSGQIAEILTSLAVGSERFKNNAKDLARLEKVEEGHDDLEKQIADLVVTVGKLEQTVQILRNIIFGGIAFVLMGIGGAVLTLVLKG